jgi:hypothetical protein
MPPAKKQKTSDCPVAAALVSDLVQIGSDAAQVHQMGKPFPLVLSPAKDGVRFVELQEYFRLHHAAIVKAASEVRDQCISRQNARAIPSCVQIHRVRVLPLIPSQY